MSPDATPAADLLPSCLNVTFNAPVAAVVVTNVVLNPYGFPFESKLFAAVAIGV